MICVIFYRALGKIIGPILQFSASQKTHVLFSYTTGTNKLPLVTDSSDHKCLITKLI